MDARRSHPIMPHHFKRPWPVARPQHCGLGTYSTARLPARLLGAPRWPFALLLLLLQSCCTQAASSAPLGVQNNSGTHAIYN